MRHSGEPYLVHPLEVADFLADMKLDVVAICAGLLHDVVEDTLVSTERIAELFGDEIAHVVEGVTKLGAIPFSTSEERQAENLRKMLLAMVDDIRVILVKLADRLHNMRTLQHLADDKRTKIAQETLDIYAPIANRLGMSKLKNELEELAFKALEPESYEALRAKVESKRKHAESLIDDLAARVRAKLEEAQVPVIAVDGRIKRLFSIHRKLLRQKIDLAQVYDFIALRVITASVKDCYATLGIIHQTWSPVPGRIKDFVAMPRPNGYQSLHTSVISEQGVPFEVQIRSEEMHRRAEEGIAAHWKYKEGRIGDQRDERYFQWLRQLLELQQEVRDPQEFMQNLKIDLYPEEVYVFTPKGEVRSLPRGATPVDFAYGVHTDVGHQCVAALINGKMAPLRTKLQNGDIVQINTQPGHRPSRDWLSFVVTSRARSKIKHVLQAEERSRSIEFGRRLFEKEARRFDLNPKTLLESAEMLAFADGVRRAENRGSAGLRRLRQAGAAHAGAEGRSWRAAARAGARFGRGVGGQARAAHRRRVGQDQGPRRRRHHGVPGAVLQSDSRRAHRRLHHPGQGRVGALGHVPQRRQPDVRPRASHRGRVGRPGRPGALRGEADDAGRGPQGHAGRDQLEGVEHQHQHHQHGSARRLRSPGAHRDDGGDPRREAPGQGDQVDQGRRGGAGRGAHRAPGRGGEIEQTGV